MYKNLPLYIFFFNPHLLNPPCTAAPRLGLTPRCFAAKTCHKRYKHFRLLGFLRVSRQPNHPICCVITKIRHKTYKNNLLRAPYVQHLPETLKYILLLTPR